MKKKHNAHGGTRKGASHKKELALALCVSLWMAGGGVAWAGETVTLNEQPNADGTGYTVSGANIYLNPGYDKLELTGGTWNSLNRINAGYTTNGANLSGYSLSVAGPLNASNSINFYGAQVSNATAATTISGNAVNIDHGSITTNGEYGTISLYGSQIQSKKDGEATGGSASNNSVNIDHGTLTATVAINISGENTDVPMIEVTDGRVKISDSVLSSTGQIYIFGIDHSVSDVTGGSVMISGAWDGANNAPTTRLSAGSGIYIYAANNQGHSSAQGSVSLSGDVGFKGSVYLYGKHNWAAGGTGNTLHIGTDGTKDAVWRGYTSTDGAAWTQTNAINYVYNFDTIALHAVDFTAALPALGITGELAYYSGNNTQPDLSDVTLDLTKLSFEKDGAAYTPKKGDSVTLLKYTPGQYDNPKTLTGMKLAYDAATQAAPVPLTTAGVTVTKSDTDTSAGVTLDYTSVGTVALANENKDVTYEVKDVNATKLTFGNVEWKDSGALIDHTTKWAGISFNGAAVDTTKLAFTNPGSAGGTMTLIANAGALANPANTVSQSYALNPVDGLSIDAALNGSVALSGNDLTYSVTSNQANKLTFTDVEWKDSGALLDHTATLTNVSFDGAAVDTTKLAFTNPGSAGGTMTLIANAGALANPANTVSQSYALNPVDGLSIDAALNGSVALSGNDLTYSVTSNQANKLTFGDVEWKETGALLTRPANITFAGADVDTTNINFTNIKSLEANKKMTLVSDFGNSVGTITGTKYKVGSTLEGTGKASLVGSDLIFTAETGTGGKPDVEPQEQTHNTVMGATVSMAALSAGNDFVGAATEGLSLASNVGADGVSSFAQMGGGSMRQETGSHVDTHTWNAILALGHANKKERGTFEYGAFFEYGSGNYTTHNGDERGDGSMHYTGGGLLAKWTANHGLYVEGSLRAGSVHDDARNVLRDVQTRVPYSYETNAPYMGFHLGVGKEIALTNGNTVDVYGKYFYNRKNSVSFDVGAGDHYDLDAVTSQVVRVGARYNIKRDKWNFYAGAAYEHELDGKAAGTASNGGVSAAIRGADTSGASFRGEIGATMKPDKNSPWSLDLNVSGFAGKKQGFAGGVSVAFMF